MALPTYKMLINNKLVAGDSGSFPVTNPSTGKVFAEAPECSKAQLEEAVKSAKEAFPGWASAGVEKHKELLNACAGKLIEKIAPMTELLVKEQGKPLSHAQMEVGGVAHFFSVFAEMDIPWETVLSETDDERVIEKRTPLGVVAGITPWNFPVLMAGWKIAEALCTGNTIVIKPSPFTPLTSLMLGEVLSEVLPPGVVNVVSGGNDLGKWLTEHQDVKKVSFTGSTNTGKAIQVAAASNLKSLTLELGGNDAAIMLPDVDVATAAKEIFNKAMLNSGQICVAVKRLFVHESKFDDTVKALAQAAEAAKVGDGFGEGVTHGPINNKPQFDRVNELVEDAKQHGALVIAGGAPVPGDGYFYPPTILTNVAEGHRIVDEEQFGPVLPVMSYKTVEEAVSRANATNFGLGGSVWGSDLNKTVETAGEIDAGTVWVNDHGKLSPDAPFGGLKESGVGRQFGDGTVHGYTQASIIRVKKK